VVPDDVYIVLFDRGKELRFVLFLIVRDVIYVRSLRVFVVIYNVLGKRIVESAGEQKVVSDLWSSVCARSEATS